MSKRAYSDRINWLLQRWSAQHKPRPPLRIWLAGGSGSGKSTIAEMLVERLRPLTVTLLNQDQFFKPVAQLPTFYSEYHRAPRPDFNRPDSFFTEEMFAAYANVTGCDVVIVEGILVLHYPELRRLWDIQCYVLISLEEMLYRRTERNLARGYGGPFAEIAHYNTECVTPQHHRYNLPQQRYADVIIPNDQHEESDRDSVLDWLSEQILNAFMGSKDSQND